MFLEIIIISFILGILIGSFLNVIIYRFGTGKSVISGGSMCMNCATPLKTRELVPVISFLIQKGKCRSCGVPLSWQYPIVELVSGIIFVLVFIRQYKLYENIYSFYENGLWYSILFLVYYWAISSLLIVITVYDIRHKIIPFLPSIIFILLSLIKLFVFLFFINNTGFSIFIYPYLYDLLAPIILALPFVLLWLVSSGRWIGLGDAQLAFGFGALLGFVGGLNSIVVGFWVGTIICLVGMFMEKLFPGIFGELKLKSQVPLGPFLVSGLFVVLFLGVDPLVIGNFFN